MNGDPASRKVIVDEVRSLVRIVVRRLLSESRLSDGHLTTLTICKSKVFWQKQIAMLANVC